jgi:hypothetical protein
MFRRRGVHAENTDENHSRSDSKHTLATGVMIFSLLMYEASPKDIVGPLYQIEESFHEFQWMLECISVETCFHCDGCGVRFK